MCSTQLSRILTTMQTLSTRSLKNTAKSLKESTKPKLMEFKLTQFCNCAKVLLREQSKSPTKQMLIVVAINILAVVEQVVPKGLIMLVLNEKREKTVLVLVSWL